MKNVLFRKFILIISTAFLCNIIIAQDYATDFTAEDCEGDTFNLFESLDQGRVIVIAWVMPCFGCISPSLNAYNTVLNHEAFSSGQLDFIVVDDYADTNCSTLVSWCNENGIVNVPVFVNSNISMSDYGQNGMPKIIVVGCSNHRVYFNSNIGVNGIEDAIDDAISDCASNETADIDLIECVRIFPNPIFEEFTITYRVLDEHELTINIIDLSGKIVFSSKLPNETTSLYNKTFEGLDLKNGSYVVSIYSNNKIKFTETVFIN